MTEEWRPVPGLKDIEASNFGRIRRVRMMTFILKTHNDGTGYPRVRIYKSGRDRYRLLVHRLIAKAFFGEPPTGYEVNHKDGNKANACVTNLEYVTRSENHRHKHDVLGCVVNQGQNHGQAKLTDTDAIAIRKLRSEGAKLTELAAQFGVSVQTICGIGVGRTWRHLL